jgi:hypothetical protein
MKSVIKFAVGAATAGALVNILTKRRPGSGNAVRGSTAPTPTELVADTSSVGEGSGDERVLLPDDGRVKMALPD